MRVLAFILLVSLCAADAHAVRAVFVVRHAEKANPKDKDSPLSIAGEDRGLALARLLRSAKISAVFATHLKRTQQTARAAAEQRGLKPVVLQADDTKGLLAAIQKLPADAVVLVVGHSDTVPEIVAGLGVKEPISVRDDEYGRVFEVLPRADGSAALVELSY